MFDFPALDRPTVFLASPGDVTRLRDRATAVFQSMRGRLGEDVDLKLYDWDEEIGNGGFNSGRPAQAQIARPDDPQVKATLCIFGERLGRPMPSHTPMDGIESLEATAADLPYRLVHPWVSGADEAGGFALTGTVFECLSAISAGGNLYLAVFGDEGVRDVAVPIENANFGDQVHLRAKSADFGRDRRGLRQWEEDVYFVQLRQLRNFLLYLDRLGHQINYLGVNEDAFKVSLQAFLQGCLSPAPATVVPFKGLQVYDVDDHDIYFGRALERQRAIADIEKIWDDSALPTAFCIMGGSGAGKSSFLRAGVIGRMCAGARHLRHLVVRPAELLQVDVGADTLTPEQTETLGRKSVEDLVAQILQALNREAEQPSDLIAPARATLATRTIAALPEAACDLIDAAVSDRGERSRLILAIDQFEELVDQIREPALATAWTPTILLLRALIRTRRAALIYTLQANRVGYVADDTLLAPLLAEGQQMTLDFPEQGLPDIICQPFKATGKVELTDQLEKALLKSVREFKEREDRARHHGSLLPLISLTLKRIYENCAVPALAARAEAEARTEKDKPGAIQAFGEATESSHSVVLRLDLEACAGNLEIGKAISDLADAAVVECRESLGPTWTDSVVGDLLRRLVAVADDDHRKFSLPDAERPSSPAQRALANSLAERRLILREPNERIRLVHEAVLDYWPAATEWVEKERPVLNDVRIAQAMAEEWARGEDGQAFLKNSGVNDIERASAILGSWADILTDQTTLDRSQRTRTLRDYALELLGAHPAPSALAARTERGTTRLMQIAYYERRDLVKQFLEIDPDSVHLTRTDKRNVVFYPAFSGDMEMLEDFIRCGAALDISDADGWRPIHAAATSGHADVVKRLIDCGATLSGEGAPGETTPMTLACRAGALDTVKALLAAGALIDAARSGGWRPLHDAAFGGADVVCDFLLASGINPDTRVEGDLTPLCLAAQEGHIPVALSLLAAGAAIDGLREDEVDGTWRARLAPDTPLQIALRNNREDFARLLIERGADVISSNRSGESPLSLAANRDDLSLLRVIIATGVNLDTPISGHKTALDVAVEAGREASARLLVEAGASVDLPVDHADAPPGRQTRLHVAAGADNAKVVALLLSLGAALDRRDEAGQTSLHKAAARAGEAMVRTLLAAGADKTARDSRDMTAFDLAALRGDVTLMEILAPTADDLAAPDASRASPLHLAAVSGASAALRWLLERGLDPDARDRDGLTPLLVVAERGQVDATRILLEAGADPTLPGLEPSVTALEVAVRLGHADVAALLLPYHRPPPPDLVAQAADSGHEDVIVALLAAGLSLEDPADVTSSPIVRYLAAIARGVQSPGDKAARIRRLAEVSPNALLDEVAARYDAEEGAAAQPIALPDNLLESVSRPRADPPKVVGLDGGFSGRNATVTHLPFYARHRLMKVPVGTRDGAIRHILLGDDGKEFILNGSSVPIHFVNKQEYLKIESEMAIEYLTFFCLYLRSEDKVFFILSAGIDKLLPDNLRRHPTIIRNARPPTLSTLPSGEFEVDAFIIYGHELSKVKFRIKPEGSVEMLEEDILSGDLPDTVSLPLG